jgi:hypothetical protein
VAAGVTGLPKTAQTANWDGSTDQPINPNISLVFLEERYVFFWEMNTPVFCLGFLG